MQHSRHLETFAALILCSTRGGRVHNVSCQQFSAVSTHACSRKMRDMWVVLHSFLVFYTMINQSTTNAQEKLFFQCFSYLHSVSNTFLVSGFALDQKTVLDWKSAGMKSIETNYYCALQEMQLIKQMPIKLKSYHCHSFAMSTCSSFPHISHQSLQRFLFL